MPTETKQNQKELPELHVADNYIRASESPARIVMLEGGTRSAKTYSLAQLYVTLMLEKASSRFSIVRKALPSLKATVMEDLWEIMFEYDLYDKNLHNKTDLKYHLRSNVLDYFSVDNQQKVRGRKRDYLWINEANELTYQEFAQLAFRTKKKIFMDFNPVEEDHWIIEKVLNVRDDVELISSNYLDNPFLEEGLIREIEALQAADEQYWRVFGLGERPVRGQTIYSHFQLVDEFPENCDEIIYGIDFGFNHATAITRIGLKDGATYWDELLHLSGLTNSMLITAMDRLRKEGLLTSNMQGFGDAAEPDRIEEINYPTVKDDNGKDIQGFNVKKADKSVKDGIDKVKSMPSFMTKRSINLIEEKKKYMWKVNKDGKILDEPVKANDDGLDAGRYAVYSYFKELGGGSPNIRLL